MTISEVSVFWRDVLPAEAAVSALNSKHDTHSQEEEGGNPCFEKAVKTQILQQNHSGTVAHLKITYSVERMIQFHLLFSS